MKKPGTLSSALKAVTKSFRKYSVQDIATSLFVSNLWLPNIASPVKHLFLTAALASGKPEEFTDSDAIRSYEAFKSFLKEVYTALPAFPSLEDYLPETDWGNVRFYFNERNYRIFYGSELSNPYDYLTIFQMLYEPIEDECLTRIGRSPMQELRRCLLIQDTIISGITTQPTADDIPISFGHLEIPPQPFWENASSFYQTLLTSAADDPLIKHFSMPLGSLPRSQLSPKKFGELIFESECFPAFFVAHDGRHYPALPRRYSLILFDAWGRIFGERQQEITADVPYDIRINGEVYKFTKKRVKETNVFPLVTALTSDGRAQEVLFSMALALKDKLVLVYIVPPGAENQSEHLQQVAPKLEEAVKLIGTSPNTFVSHLREQKIEHRASEDARALAIELFVVIPKISTRLQEVLVPLSLPGRVIFLDDFLGIIDELNDIDELSDFIDYLDGIDQHQTGPFASVLDKFGSFRSSHGTLIGGARTPHLVMLDPHWGSSLRYKSLAEFWSLYPSRGFFDHPRSWKVSQDTPTRVRLEARGYFAGAFYCKVGSTDVFVNAPFQEMTFTQARIVNLLMECLEDYFSRHRDTLSRHRLFRTYAQFQIMLFPLSLVSENERLQHLRHLQPGAAYWCSDMGMPKKGVPGVRMVFDDHGLQDALIAAQDRSLEVSLVLEVLDRVESRVPDHDTATLLRQEIERETTRPPRFRMVTAEKPASFPDLVRPCIPAPSDFKRAKKRIAELAREYGLTEGRYVLEEAKGKLNALRRAIVEEINTEVTQYSFQKTIPYLLVNIDALTHEWELKKMVFERAAEQDIDYERDARYAEEKEKYLRTHKNYRYLIEKFVQLCPTGQAVLCEDRCKYLLALIDWLLVIYNASDVLHYDIAPVGMKIDQDFLIEIEHEVDAKAKQEMFAKEQAQLELGAVSKPDDSVASPRSVDEFLNDIDPAFMEDVGFTLRNLVSVLALLSRWPLHKPDLEERPYYSASADEIIEVGLQTIEGTQREEIRSILDFCTLKSDDVLRVLELDVPCDDIPVWEYTKRYARYTLRPLISIEDKYFWGPYSVRSSGMIWSGTASLGSLPTDLQGPTIEKALRKEKELLEQDLVRKTYEIVRRHTPHVEHEVELHKVDKVGKHPQELGDYDVLAFHPKKNVVLNIECKDLLQVHCVKDAKRLREKIFGQAGKDEGQFGHINKRRSYLSDRVSRIAAALKWPIDANSAPRIITIYLTRRTYWWTRFPPQEIGAVFLQVDLLEKFIDDLGG